MGILDSLFGKKIQEKPVTNTAPTKKVLIVEDDAYIRDAYAEIIRGEGFDVITATNGKEGLDSAVTQKPNLILLDLMLPIMDGKQLLHELRLMPEFAQLPVIVLTNAGTSDNIKETKFYNNASEFLIKSNVTPADILAKIKSLT